MSCIFVCAFHFHIFHIFVSTLSHILYFIYHSYKIYVNIITVNLPSAKKSIYIFIDPFNKALKALNAGTKIKVTAKTEKLYGKGNKEDDRN